MALTAGYPAHRLRQRARILEAAAGLFDQRGIDRVTMAEITAATGLRVSTIYQYFSNKDEIVWAIVHDLMAAGKERTQASMKGASSGFEKISALLSFMADELANNAAEVRFMAQFDALYAHDWPAERLLTLESQIGVGGFRNFRQIVKKGIADGSLRSDLDPDLTLHAIINAVVGAQRRLAALGPKIEAEFGQPVDRLFRETLRLLLLGLRAPETPNSEKRKPRKSAS